MVVGPSPSRAGEVGFTLIELLVALALMGMAATLLLAGVKMAGLVTLHERVAAGGLDDVIATQRMLRTGIERLRPITRVDVAQPIVEFRGTEGILSYVGPPLDRSAPDALQRFRLARAANGDLVLYNISTRKGGVDTSGFDLVGWTPTTLLKRTANLSFSYLGTPLAGGERAWLSNWWDRGRPPELIRIHVEFAPGDPRQWPDLLIRPRATTAAVCTINVNTGRCAEAP